MISAVVFYFHKDVYELYDESLLEREEPCLYWATMFQNTVRGGASCENLLKGQYECP